MHEAKRKCLIVHGYIPVAETGSKALKAEPRAGRGGIARKWASMSQRRDTHSGFVTRFSERDGRALGTAWLQDRACCSSRHGRTPETG